MTTDSWPAAARQGNSVPVNVFHTTRSAVDELDRLAERAYREVLAVHGDQLLRAHFDPHAVQPAELVQRLSELPEPFVRLALDLRGLTDPIGVNHLMAAASRHGVRPLRAVRPIERAARILIDHPQVFAEAVALVNIEPTRPLHEYVGLELRDPRVERAALRATEAELGQHFYELTGGRYCEIHPWERDGQLFFQIDHTNPRTFGRRWDGGSIKTNGGWPIGTDLVIFGAGNLRIGTQDLPNRELHRRTFGRLLFGEEAWFRPMQILSFEPLRAPANAFAPTSEVSGVRLVQVRPHRGRTVEPSSKNTHPHIGAGYRTRTIRELHLEIRHRRDSTWHPVVLFEPNAMSTGNWSDDRVARRFLIERGFLANPLQSASPVAETYLLVRTW